MYTLSIIIFALIASLIVIFFIRFYAHLAFPSETKPIRLSSSDYDFTVYKDSSFREDVIQGRIVIPESLSGCILEIARLVPGRISRYILGQFRGRDWLIVWEAHSESVTISFFAVLPSPPSFRLYAQGGIFGYYIPGVDTVRFQGSEFGRKSIVKSNQHSLVRQIVAENEELLRAIIVKKGMDLSWEEGLCRFRSDGLSYRRAINRLYMLDDLVERLQKYANAAE